MSKFKLVYITFDKRKIMCDVSIFPEHFNLAYFIKKKKKKCEYLVMLSHKMYYFMYILQAV